jgi:TolB-like protein
MFSACGRGADRRISADDGCWNSIRWARTPIGTLRRYAATGEIGAALKQYERCPALRDLAAKPSPETEGIRRSAITRALSAPRADNPANWTRQGIQTAPVLKPSVAVHLRQPERRPGQQQFSDGIRGDLTPIFRGSATFVKGAGARQIDARQASQELGVRYLEGGVQRAAGAAHQCPVDAVTSSASVGQTRPGATGLFAIQDEVVEAIVAELAVARPSRTRPRRGRRRRSLGL